MPKISELPLATEVLDTDEYVFVQDSVTKKAPRSFLLSDVTTNISSLSTTVDGISATVGTLQTTVDNIPTNVILTDGSINMDAGYVPLNALSVITKEYFDSNQVVIDPNTAYTNVAQTYTVPQRASITLEDNTIDFSASNNFELTASIASLNAVGKVAGQCGNIIIHNAENITGWSADYKFKNVPLDLFGDEIFGYFIDDLLNIWIGRVQ